MKPPAAAYDRQRTDNGSHRVALGRLDATESDVALGVSEPVCLAGGRAARPH